jgi:hypothetical protein
MKGKEEQNESGAWLWMQLTPKLIAIKDGGFAEDLGWNREGTEPRIILESAGVPIVNHWDQGNLKVDM